MHSDIFLYEPYTKIIIPNCNHSIDADVFDISFTPSHDYIPQILVQSRMYSPNPIFSTNFNSINCIVMLIFSKVVKNICIELEQIGMKHHIEISII